MEISVINIGNSKGIRLPKTILDKYNINDKLEMVLEKECIVLKPKHEPRKNWEEAFRMMHDNSDDELLIDDVFEDESFE
ncbi:MAG: AbrB/MazE/SpoVT family DNA-binding domain-containing protein [Runella sp.]